MKMTPGKIFICLFLLFAACSNGPERDHPYTSEGLTMNLPPNWNVTKDKTDTTVGTRLITIEDKNPDNTGGDLIISRLNDTLDLNVYMEILIRNTTESMTKRDISLKLVSKMKALRIGSLQALRVYFECLIQEQLIAGSFTVFNLDGKTYSATFNAGGKNSKEKDATVDRIIRSFKKYSE